MIDSPLKINGKKGKLIDWIRENAPEDYGRVFDVFMGSGIVGLNLIKTDCVFADINPHVIHFFNFLKEEGSPEVIREHLIEQGNGLTQEKFKEIRVRFNKQGDPRDFIFLTRSCFNGLMRFNSKGGFNTPYCKKDDRFSKAYVTKIYNILKQVQPLAQRSTFLLADFEETISMAKKGDLIYLDPPYFGLHATYFDTWTEESERRLADCLAKTEAHFLLSTWKDNGVRVNPMIEKYWSKYRMETRAHKYHIGAKVENRREVTEVLIKNF